MGSMLYASVILMRRMVIIRICLDRNLLVFVILIISLVNIIGMVQAEVHNFILEGCIIIV